MTIIDKLRCKSIFAENENYIIRNLTDNDRQEYIHILKSVSSIPQIYETDGFEDITWKEATASVSALTLVVLRKTDNSIIGDCMIKFQDTETIEIGLDISKVYQNQGIGTEVLRLFIAEIRKRLPEKKIVVRIYSDNVKSQHIIKTLGAIKISEEPSEYDAAMSIMKEIYNETGLSLSENIDLLSENHIDVFVLTY